MSRVRRPFGRHTTTVLTWTLVPLAITMLAWQPRMLTPDAGIDPSWQAGLEMAVHDGITFGNHLIFTYGPLGFLTVPQLWYIHLGELAFAYTAVLRLALAAALYAGSRQSFGRAVSFVIAVVVASIGTQLSEMVVFLIAAVAVIERRVEGRPALGAAAAAGAFAGIEFLVKVSVGISLAAMTAVLVLGLPSRRLRAAAGAIVGALVALLAGWAATGQSFGAIGDYFVNSERIVSGYAGAMELAIPSLAWEHTAAFVALALGLWGAWQMSAAGTRRRRLGIAGLWIVFWFFAFKEGFVREDPLHTSRFFGAVLGGFVAFGWRHGQRAAALVGIAALAAFALASQSASLGTDVDPSRDVKAAWQDLRDVTTRAAALSAAGRAEIAAGEPIDPPSLRLLRGHTVAVFPQEIALDWTYGLDWDPLPVEQSYSAYTPALDEIDADDLASSRAPQRLLLYPTQPEPDGRLIGFDESETSRAIICRYRSLRTTRALDVLARGADRCSAPSQIAVVHADWNQAVPIPAPPGAHSLVSVRIAGVDAGGFERIEGLFYKPAERFVILDGQAPKRLVAATAADGLPLRASPGVDLPAPFNLAPGAATIAVSRSGLGPTGGKPLTYSFFAQSVTPPP
jgi:hypothetical protein